MRIDGNDVTGYLSACTDYEHLLVIARHCVTKVREIGGPEYVLVPVAPRSPELSVQAGHPVAAVDLLVPTLLPSKDGTALEIHDPTRTHADSMPGTKKEGGAAPNANPEVANAGTNTVTATGTGNTVTFGPPAQAPANGLPGSAPLPGGPITTRPNEPVFARDGRPDTSRPIPDAHPLPDVPEDRDGHPGSMTPGQRDETAKQTAAFERMAAAKTEEALDPAVALREKIGPAGFGLEGKPEGTPPTVQEGPKEGGPTDADAKPAKDAKPKGKGGKPEDLSALPK